MVDATAPVTASGTFAQIGYRQSAVGDRQLAAASDSQALNADYRMLFAPDLTHSPLRPL
jgi:hypothetical protein